MNIFPSVLIGTPEELLQHLEKLKSEGYQFRGQTCNRFFLQPSAFRMQRAKGLMESFVKDSGCNKWRVSREVEDYYIKQLGFRQSCFDRVRYITLFIMLYNYNFAKYYETEVLGVQRTDLILDEQTENYLTKHSSCHWLSEMTFKRGMQIHLERLVYCLDNNNCFLKKPDIITDPKSLNLFTGAEEMPFQHYGVSTMILDWTSDPDIAIYFSTKNIPDSSNYFSIYAYKQIIEKDSPVLLSFGSDKVINERQNRQKGRFTYFSRPWDFYYFRGRWPSIDDYVACFPGYSQYFDVVRYDISTEYKHIQYFKKMLDEKSITQEYLMDENTMEFRF